MSSLQSIYCFSIQVAGASIPTKSYFRNVKSPTSFLLCILTFSGGEDLLVYSSSRIIHCFNLMQNLLTFYTGLLMFFPNIRVAFTFVIKNVIPIKNHFRFDYYIPSQYLSRHNSRMPSLTGVIYCCPKTMAVARFSWWTNAALHR